MTISRNVYNQLFEQAPSSPGKEQVIRLRPTEAKAGAVVVSAKSQIKMWTKDEHDRFLAALEKYPSGPWKKVADYIGTKTPRQTMTHAQKYRQKIHRRQRGLRNQKKTAASAEGDAAAAAADTAPVTISDAPAPTPVDTKAEVQIDSKTLVSPYGVAELELKQLDPAKHAEAMAVITAAAAAGATNVQLLSILAQQAAMSQDGAEGADPQNLPSLAEILHLSGAAETEEKEEEKKEEDGDQENQKEASEEKQGQEKTEKCKCSCKCGAHKKDEAQETTTQPRPQEEALI